MLDAVSFFVVKSFTLAAKLLKARPTHRYGVEGRGQLRILETLAFPCSTFFVPGEALDVVIRHANLDDDDDAGLQIRSGSLQLRSQAGERLDLPMNTGEANTFQTLWVLLDFMRSKPFGARGIRSFSRRHPRIWRDTLNAHRRAPSSFTQLRYHGQLIFRYEADDGVARLVRFRLGPSNDEAESGHPVEEDHDYPFSQQRAPDEKRAKDYLRAEWRQRVSAGGASYKFYLQLHEVQSDDPNELLDTSRIWDDRAHPWHEVGDVLIDSLLTPEEGEAIRFNIANQPQCMGLLPATSASDFNSPAYVRTLVYASTQEARLRSRP